jgi:hypothetical protein
MKKEKPSDEALEIANALAGKRDFKGEWEGPLTEMRLHFLNLLHTDAARVQLESLTPGENETKLGELKIIALRQW